MDITSLLLRTNLKLPFEKFIKIVEQNYPRIEFIQQFTPIFEGYEDTNIILETSNGKYVLKIYATFRKLKNIFDYAKVIREASNIGVLTLEIVPSLQGDICKYEDTYFMVTKFFNGSNFLNTTPTLDEMLSVTESIAKLNTLNFDIEESYDSWGNKNLVKEYKESKVKNIEVMKDILPLIDIIGKLDLTGFSKGVIHGDMQRKHVLKDENRLCIIDYGCMSYDLKVYDLSTFLAWFCLAEDTWNNRDEIYKKVIKKYTEHNPLSKEERDSLKILTASSYGAYYLKTTELIENGDNSKETLDWNIASKQMFSKMMGWINS